MADLNLPQIGNYVTYRGRLNEFNDRIGKIVRKETLHGVDHFCLQIRSHAAGETQEIWAQPREIGTIALDNKILKNLGFEFDERHKIFYLGPLHIALVRKVPEDATPFGNGAYRTKEGGTVYDFGQYHIVEEPIENFKTAADWETNATLIAEVNALQNYSLSRYGHDFLDDKLSTLLGRQSLTLFSEET